MKSKSDIISKGFLSFNIELLPMKSYYFKFRHNKGNDFHYYKQTFHIRENPISIMNGNTYKLKFI